MRACRGFTRSARSASRTPRKERTSERTKTPETVSRNPHGAFAPQGPRVAPHLGGFRATLAHPFALFPPPPASIPRGFRRRCHPRTPTGPGPNTRRSLRGARSCSRDAPCGPPRCTIEIRPISFCHPTLKSTSTHTRLLPVHRPPPQVALVRSVHPPGCAQKDRGIERFTTPESLRRVARDRGGCFIPVTSNPRWQPTSDTPVALPPRAHRPPRSR